MSAVYLFAICTTKEQRVMATTLREAAGIAIKGLGYDETFTGVDTIAYIGQCEETDQPILAGDKYREVDNGVYILTGHDHENGPLLAEGWRER